jgi:hypothetical protein
MFLTKFLERLTSANTQWAVFGVDSLLVVLELLRGDIEGKMVADESSNATNLNGRELPL